MNYLDALINILCLEVVYSGKIPKPGRLPKEIVRGVFKETTRLRPDARCIYCGNKPLNKHKTISFRTDKRNIEGRVIEVRDICERCVPKALDEAVYNVLQEYSREYEN